MSSLRVHVNLANGPRPVGRGAAAAATTPGRRGLRTLLARASRAVLNAHDISEADLSLTLLDDAAIADLNLRFLQRAGPTDVLAFPLFAAGEAPVGDIYVGYEQALQQAAELGISPREELARLAIHGTLHVLGYEHPEGSGRESSRMWQLQENLLREVLAT